VHLITWHGLRELCSLWSTLLLLLQAAFKELYSCLWLKCEIQMLNCRVYSLSLDWFLQLDGSLLAYIHCSNQHCTAHFYTVVYRTWFTKESWSDDPLLLSMPNVTRICSYIPTHWNCHMEVLEISCLIFFPWSLPKSANR
jgi:hypothetical protein